MATETPYQKFNIVDANGNIITSFGGSGGDASAANQQSQIEVESQIRDRLPSALVGGRLPVDVQSLSVTVNNAQLEIANDSGNPIPVSGTVAISGTPTVTISNSSIEIANDVGNPVPISGTVAISNSSVEIANDVGNPIPVNGTVAISGTPTVTISNSSIEIANDVGNPVPVSGTVTVNNTEFLAYLEGIYNSTLPIISNGSKANLQLSSRGELLTSFIDFISSTINISAADIGSTSNTGADSQVIYSGTPTTNSFASATVSGDSSFAIQIDGTFVGTLQFERSLDNGSTYTAISAFAAGTAYTRTTTTQIGRWHGNCSSSNSIRVRAIAWTSGTANVRILAGAGTGTITIGNPIRLFDQASGVQAAIKAANTLPVSTDTAIVVTQRDLGLFSSSALQTAGNNSLTSLDNKTPVLGTNTTANSRTINIASDDAIATAIRDRIGATAITGTSIPTGGVGLFGWLSAIWQLFSDRIPTLTLTGTALSVSIKANSAGTGGQTPYKLISTTSTNAQSVKNSAGNLYGIIAIGLTSTVRYLKLYNKASSPTVGTDVPVLTIPIPANTQGAGVVIQFATGVNFAAGLAIAITGGVGDTDATAIAANDVVINLTYS
jgi:hypothetical protein